MKRSLCTYYGIGIVIRQHRNAKPEYCKSRIFCTHSIFVSWALRPFVRMNISYGRWPLQILWHALYLPHAFYFRTEGAAYEIYENNMHTKYSGFTVTQKRKLNLKNLPRPKLPSRDAFCMTFRIWTATKINILTKMYELSKKKKLTESTANSRAKYTTLVCRKQQ